MAYILATTDDQVRWYSYKIHRDLKEGEYELLDVLDLSQVPLAADKNTAKECAKALGLKTWRYVKL